MSSLGPLMLKDQAAIDHDNEVELPKRKAAYEAWSKRMISLRHAANEAGKKAASAFKPGVGVTRPDLWKAAAAADREAEAHARTAIATHAWTSSRPGSLQYTEARNNGLGDASDEAAIWAKSAAKHEQTAIEAAQNEEKVKIKEAADKAAAEKAAKNKASAEKRKATLAAKNAGLKEWAKT